VVGQLEAVAGAVTATAICVFRSTQNPSILKWISMVGTISYSLYLLHVPIGGRVINLACRLPDLLLVRYCAIACAFAVSLGSAYLFWYAVERPSQVWAKAKVKHSLTKF